MAELYDNSCGSSNDCQSEKRILDHYFMRSGFSKQDYCDLIDNLADGFIMVDTDLKILHINPALAQLLEYSPSELMNNNLLKLSYSNKDQLTLLLGITKRRHGQRDSYELTLRSRNGSPVMTYVNPSPLYDRSGQVVGSYGIIKDLTEFRRSYHKVLFQAQLLEQISDGVISADSQGRIQYFNNKLEQILGVSDLASDSTTLQLVESWLLSLKHQTAGDIEYSHPDGSTRYLRLSTENLSPMSSSNYSTVTVISDLSDLLRTHKEAEVANQARTDLLANIIHDIRTPMIGILGASDLLSQEMISSYHRDLIRTIQQCSETLLGLINDILDLSRMKAGFAVLINREFRLQQLVEECLLMIQTRIDPSKITLYTDIDPDIPDLLVSDPLQLRRIMLNLLSNAAKFTSCGHISIYIKIAPHSPQTDPNKLWLEFSVEDTGTGIPEDKLATIFEAFHQVSKYDDEGTGLGLSICRELVHLFGGDIIVSSKPGRGTTFCFTIPVDIPAASTFLADSISSQLPSGVRYNKHILIVDDNDVNRHVLSSLLERKGYSVSAARNGYECLSFLRDQPVDLVLMDMQMPVLNGYDTVRQIRFNPSCLSLPIIAMTASVLKDEHDKCLQTGCNALLLKPFSSEALYAAVEKHLTLMTNETVSEQELDNMRQALMPEFVTMLEVDLARMKKAQELKDWDSIACIAHDIKGSSGIFGYDDISALSARLYSCSNHGDAAETALTLTELEESLEKIKASMRS